MIGKVLKVNAGFYDILSSDEKVYRTRGSGNLRETSQNPLVGDQVKFNPDGFLFEILPRKNFLIRPKVANIDQVVIVTALTQPKFSSFLLDKFLAIIEFQEIEPIILFTKSDLIDDKIYCEYKSQGYKVLKISNEDKNQDFTELVNLLKGKLSVFTGQSGAGKSSTINNISNLDIKTQIISKSLGRGKHTTRTVEIYRLDEFELIDTPGFSILESNLSENDLAKSFHDFRKLSFKCEFRTCIHFREINCKIKDEVEKGNIMKSRYDNYLRLISEVKENER
ncbi:MAG: ribosome small subunit-dependent GTPase A [Mycoplasmataceae bacterium]|nr:ribosome small subunit-dependent GTPase A [Mycoplasmataceae bacterium]